MPADDNDSKKQKRLELCESLIEKALSQYNLKGIEASDVFETLVGFVVATALINGLSKKETLKIVDDTYQDALDNMTAMEQEEVIIKLSN